MPLQLATHEAMYWYRYYVSRCTRASTGQGQINLFY